DAHVHGDLRHRRRLHDRAQAELVLQPRAQSGLVLLLQAWPVAVPCCHQRSISSPQSARLQMRTLTCSPLVSLILVPTRVGRRHVGQTTMTFPTAIAAAFSITPPGAIWEPPMRLESLIGFGLVCRLTTFRFSTITLRSAGFAWMT